MSPEELLKSAMGIMEKKRRDYVTNPMVNPHENFERCTVVVNWFKSDIDKVYATLVTVKLARLASLLSSDSLPNNESIEDSFKDLINYAALWGSAVSKLPKSLSKSRPDHIEAGQLVKS